ncbi:hypothetical protein [Paractinoplanes deccanensis]|nr:hypothetical protein [Actinoplanes deccanensis]
MSSATTIRNTLGPLDAIWVVAAFIAGSLEGNFTTGLLCGIGITAAMGVWRLVRIQAQLLELKQAEHFADDEA